MIFCGLRAPQSAWCQTASNSLDVPQTRLAPLGSSANTIAPTQAPGGFGQTYANPPQSPGIAPVPGGVSQFDPYAGGPAAGYVPPIAGAPVPSGSILGTPVTGAPQGGIFSPSPPIPSFGTPVYGGVANQPPPIIDAGSIFTPGGLTPMAPANAYPPQQNYALPPSAIPSASPSSLFPGGLVGTTQSYSPAFNPYRLIQRARFRHTYIYDGDKDTDLAINDTDFALAFAWPQFLWSTQPLYLAPSFSLHLWDGPKSNTGADLPANAYSAFLDIAWSSDPNRIAGAELGVSLGVFSQFGVYTNDSFRVRGKGLGTFRITPASTFKLGVYYYDRLDVKVVPAVGLFWRPNPFTKVDIFFPQPKFSRYLSTVGTQDVWWYVAGELGGGSWTIERDGGGTDQVDINDIRLLLGAEWGRSERMRMGMRTMFFEFGYIGGRKLVYREDGNDNIKPGDTWGVRLGLGY